MFESHQLVWSRKTYISSAVRMNMTEGYEIERVEPPLRTTLITHPALIPHRSTSQLIFDHTFSYGSYFSVSMWVWLWEEPDRAKGDASIWHANPSYLNSEIAPGILLTRNAPSMLHPFFCLFETREKVIGFTASVPIETRK